MNTLYDHTMALLTNRLKIPLLVSEILNGSETLDDETCYAIHDTICDLPPDRALLCIALSAMSMTGIYKKASPSMQILDNTCQNILFKYSESWLRHTKVLDSNQLMLVQWLPEISEDLSIISELLELNVCFLRAKDKTATDLCEILAIQARAHAMISEEFCRMMELESKNPQITPEIASAATTNVIELSDQVH